MNKITIIFEVGFGREIIRVIIVGAQGTGKTTTGERLAKALQLPLYDEFVCLQRAETTDEVVQTNTEGVINELRRVGRGVFTTNTIGVIDEIQKEIERNEGNTVFIIVQ